MPPDQIFPSNIDWQALLHNLKRGKLVPFLGAGASLGGNGYAGLPSGSKLSQELAGECAYPGSDAKDLLRVAQYYAIKLGELPLRETINERLSHDEVQPGEVHHLLAGWPLEVVLTTNYDNLMERAFVMKGKDPAKSVYKRSGDQEQIKNIPRSKTPLVYKLHGSLEDLDSMVITEDNYIDFLISLIEGPKVPNFITNLFERYSILFIGYGLKDWNIRVLLRYFRKKDDTRWFAVQRHLLADNDNAAAQEWDSTVMYWQRNSVSVYNCDALAFLRELDRRYREDPSAPK